MKRAVFFFLGLAAGVFAHQMHTSDSHYDEHTTVSQSSPTDSVITATFEGSTYTIPVFDSSTALTFGAPNTPLPSSHESDHESDRSTHHSSTCTSKTIAPSASASASPSSASPSSASPSSVSPSSVSPSSASATSSSSATSESSSTPPSTTASASSLTTASTPAQQTTNAAHAVYLDISGVIAGGLVVGLALA